MALTSLLFPLALLSLLVVVASAEYDAPNYNSQNPECQQHELLGDHNPENHQHCGNAAGQLGSTPNLGGAGHLLGNPIGGKQNRNGHEEHQEQENFVPTNTSAYENKKAYSKITSRRRAVVEIQKPSSYENGCNKARYSILHCETDEKDYFHEILPIAELTNKYIDLKECKAYPKYSPLETCNVPSSSTSSGVNLLLLHTEEHKAYYTVGNLIYTPSTHYSVPSNDPAAYSPPVAIEKYISS